MTSHWGRLGASTVALEACAIVVVIGAFVAYLAPTLERPLLEKHAFRQTQTAYTARIFHEEGIDLLHPKLPVLGEPFEVPFEFPLFQAAASIVMDAGLEDDMAMRVTGLASFILTALLLYGLVRHVAGRIAAFASLVAFVMTPFALVWARASMIEYLATAGGVGFAWATIAWRERRTPATGSLALLAGLVGMLVKPTTAVFWVLPALLYRPESDAGASRTKSTRLVLVGLVLVPLLATAVWTRHADAIKTASATTVFLASWELQEWNFGTLAQRLDSYTWAILVKRSVNFGLGTIFLAAAALATWRSRQRWFWLGMWSAALGPPLLFTNLYIIHDYYLAAVSPALAALVGLGVGHVVAHLPQRPTVLAAAALAGLVLVYGSLEVGRGYWLRIHGAEDDPVVIPLAAEVDALTVPGQRIAIAGLDWSPAVPYYSHRRAHMIATKNERFAYDLLYDANYLYLVVADPTLFDAAALDRWRWIGSIGPHSYTLASVPHELADAWFVATDAPGPPRAGTLLRQGLRIPCGQQAARIPAGVRGTWIVSTTRTLDARVEVSANLAPLPVRRALFVATELGRGGEVTLSCEGTPALVVDVIDAPGHAAS